MIKLLSRWVKTLGLAIVIVSILEMLLPDNKTKKYIKMVMGIYILFTIVSPFIKNKELFNIENIDFDDYITKQTSSESNQISIDKKIQDLYIEELKKDIIKKLNNKNYEVKDIIVNAQISDKEEETKITKIKLEVEKSDTNNKENKQEESIENKIVVEIQKVKPVNTSKNDEKVKQDDVKKIGESDIQNIKKFLIDEYGVNEKCLEIN